jgi:membrane protein implicated in regulation of membrane protease activity
MESFLNNAVIWFGLGLALFLLEFLIPGFILFFFGIGAWIVAILTFFLDITINEQLIVFVVSSILSVVLFRNWVKRKFGMGLVAAGLLEDEFIGKTGVAETLIVPGKKGRVAFKGTEWDACSDETITPGENVIISKTESLLLFVKPTKSI